MESCSSTKLSKQIFSDYIDEIQALISNGLLNENNNTISFSHQSFLDHFAVVDMLKKISSGTNVLDLIGTLDEQTPYMRYRLLRVLQILLYNEGFFISISKSILGSDKVRYYFKCAVFEVIGQYDNPSTDLLDFVYKYFADSNWHKFVYRTVCFGRTKYIESLEKYCKYDWSCEDGLSLLYSINTKSPDLLYEKIKSFCFQSKEKDIEIYYTLSQSCADDTPAILKLRLELLKRYAELWKITWNLVDLKSQSSNSIPLIKLIIQEIDKIISINLGNDETISAFSKRFYHEIVSEVLPEICDRTKHFNPRWPNYEIGEKYDRWSNPNNHCHFSRKKVEIAKIGLCEFASKEFSSFAEFIGNFDGKNSVVYYEILANAILSLSIEHSDYAISWLCDGPENHMFIYTDNRNDYLSMTKKIIEKFSPFCSEGTYRRLECFILHWSEPAEKMIQIYKCRLTAYKESKSSVFYAFWGHLQKALLPSLEQKRLSKQAKNLIGVVNRNSWISLSFYSDGYPVGLAKYVISPVSNKYNKINDKTWLKIISTPNSKMNGGGGVDKKECFVEATHITFSDDLSRQVRQDPERFAKLSLVFPKECYTGYIIGAIRALYEHDNDVSETDFSVICDVINHYISSNDDNVIMEILGLIEHFAEKNWQEEIIQFVCDKAVNSSSQSIGLGKESKACPKTLLISAMNCVRGCAIMAMSQLIWEHNELAIRFKPIVQNAVNCTDEAIRFISFSCVLPYFNIDKDFCANELKALMQNETCILGHSGVWEVLCSDYQNDSDFYISFLIKACASGIEEVNDIAARYLCATAIYYDFNLVQQLFGLSLNEKQIQMVCEQAMCGFDNPEYYENSKAILLHYIGFGKTNMFYLSRLFREGHVEIDRDEDLILTLLYSKSNEYLIHTVLDYIYEQDQDITQYSSVLNSLTEELFTNNNLSDKYTIKGDLVKCIIKLIDRNKCNTEIMAQCLDMCDKIYQSNFYMPFIQMLDNLTVSEK